MNTVEVAEFNEALTRIVELEEALLPFAEPWDGPSRCTTHNTYKLGTCKDLGVEPECDTCRARRVLGLANRSGTGKT